MKYGENEEKSKNIVENCEKKINDGNSKFLNWDVKKCLSLILVLNMQDNHGKWENICSVIDSTGCS